MWLLDQGNDDCYCDCCTHCKYIKEIRLELFKNSFRLLIKVLVGGEFMKSGSTLTVEPELDDNTDDD